MANLEIDTLKVYNAGVDLKEVAKDYENKMTSLYNKIENSLRDIAWSSESEKGSANAFVNKALKDKRTTLKLATSMSKLADEIKDFSKKLSESVDSEP